ncbi:hypothetical protein C8F04DRAFT_1195179 [Mycena alexandri]|uniref:Uncharacterized protein n=1 Tax=Mycena alexandri TaxID=1745969 RepID=A0AAD6S783_9AGAR|nr:hypothetical protein C8F04DRAFT_1195179 [Mycena alexandri]
MLLAISLYSTENTASNAHTNLYRTLAGPLKPPKQLAAQNFAKRVRDVMQLGSIWTRFYRIWTINGAINAQQMPPSAQNSNLEERRRKGRERMAKLRAVQTDAQRERHREAQRQYRERYREQVAHRARRAAVKKNLAAGKETKLRPKARQYWSDPNLASSEEEDEDSDCSHPRLPFLQRRLPFLQRHLAGCLTLALPLPLVFALARRFWDRSDAVPVGVFESMRRDFPGPTAPGRFLHLPVDGCSGPMPTSPSGLFEGPLNGPTIERRWVGRRRGWAMLQGTKPVAKSPLIVAGARRSSSQLQPNATGTNAFVDQAIMGNHLCSLLSMSTPRAGLVATNTRAEDLLMDIRGGGKDSRYYCLPPYYGKSEGPLPAKTSGGYRFHLIAQGHLVGIFDSWVEAKASLTGYPDSSNRGYDSIEECVEAWQRLCTLGVHPHTIDPIFTRPATPIVNISPRKPRSHAAPSPVKRELTTDAAQTSVSAANLIRFYTPKSGEGSSGKTRPRPPAPAPGNGDAHSINFVIRGGGIISSSVARTEERYRELQRCGEEPDLLVTRSFTRASRFALEEEGDGEGEE